MELYNSLFNLLQGFYALRLQLRHISLRSKRGVSLITINFEMMYYLFVLLCIIYVLFVFQFNLLLKLKRAAEM